MNHLPSFFATAALLSLLSLVPAQGRSTIAASAAPYEAPPTLRADTIFPAALLKGLHYNVRENVETAGGLNRFTIDSDEGVFTADGNETLLVRLLEINAIHQLRQVSKGTEYKTALRTAATAPLDLTKSLIQQPKETMQDVAKGAWKLMSRTSQSIKGAVNGNKRSAYEESAGHDLIGFTEVKRSLALSLGIDPYSRNAVLQKVLNEIAWTSYAGKMTFSAALLPLSGGAAMAANGLKAGTSLTTSIRDHSPADLRRLNQKILTDLGLAPAVVAPFLQNPAFSPVHQTCLTHALKDLRGVAGLDVLLDLTRSAADEDDAYFFQRTTELIAWLHTGTTPISRIVSLNGFPICLARDGTVTVALHLDYGTWNPVTERFLKALLNPQSLEPNGFRIVLSGSVSPVLRGQLERLGVSLTEKLSAIPAR